MKRKDTFQKFFQLVKVDEATRFVYGLVTAERQDKDGETCHYASTMPQYKAVNDEMGKMSDGQNIMPLREMHQLKAVGAGKSIDFNDAQKEIRMGFYVSDDSTWKKVLDKVLLGFSQGGRYLKRWTENGIDYYTAMPGEVSLVDNPCLAGAVIEYGKADGTVEKFEVPELSVSELNTRFEEMRAQFDELMAKLTASKGGKMTPEQMKKCAAALGISVEEFEAAYLADGKPFSKAHTMASLHAGIEKAMGHHEEMMAHHEKMGKMHAAHAGMLGKCMKACKGMMGSEEESDKAVKALKEELAKLAPVADPGDKGDKQMDEKQVSEIVAKAVKDSSDALKKEYDEKFEKFSKELAPDNGGSNGARLQLVDRDGNVVEKTEVLKANGAINPMAVSG